MMELRRLLTLAAALNLTLGVGVVTAQTLIVRNAPPESTIELVLNVATIGSTKSDAGGLATLAVNLSANVNKTEIDAQIFVDVCDNVRRVLIVERAVQPPSQEGGCARRDMGGIFLVRQISTLVVDMAGPSPTLLLRQGRVSLAPPRAWGPPPIGLVLFGGGAFTKVRDTRALACGNVTQCSGEDAGLSYTFGAAYWVTPFLAAEGSYVKPADVTAAGTGDTFRFNSSLDAHVVTVAGKVGVPLGPVRLYGQLGANYHRATFDTTQTMTNVTEGGTQTYELETGGWGWMFGGGLEAWVAPRFAIYGEGGRAALKGAAVDDGDGAIDDRLTFILFGARVRIGG